MNRHDPIRALLIALALSAFAALPLCADVVVLQNGESLSGTLSRVRDNTLIFRTSLQGQMMTPMSEVRSLAVEGNLYITMKDGQVYYGRLGVADGAQHVFPLDGSAPIPIDATAIHETLPIPASPAPPATGSVQDWEISATPGLQWRSDSSAPVEPTARLDATGRGDTWRFEGDAIVERADPGEFPAYLRARGELSGAPDASLRPFVGAGVERDLDRSLEVRQNLALGLYHNLYADKNTTLEGITALNLEYERRRERDRERAIVAGGNSGSGYDLNLQLGLRYYRIFARNHSLSETLALFPSITNPGDFRGRSETAYTMPVTDKLRLRLELLIDYENIPLFDSVNRWNVTVGAGVNVIF